MKPMILTLLLLAGHARGEFRANSGPEQVNVLELYTSEGCSSCPPKDAWFSTLRNHSGLWKKFTPIALHVDYWNHLGWTDPFSKNEYTERQKSYANEWRNQNIYTPGLVLNGIEWRRTPGDQGFANTSLRKTGNLDVSEIEKGRFKISFKPEIEGKQWHVYGTILANGLSSDVKNGENEGRNLKHEFVAVALQHEKMNLNNSVYTADLKLSTSIPAPSFSAVFWVTKEGSQKPIQAAGGDLNEK